MDGAKDRHAPGGPWAVGVAAASAEAIRQALSAHGWLDAAFVPARDGDTVWFALTHDAPAARIASTLAPTARVAVERRALASRPERTRSYQDLLSDLPAAVRDDLPSSFDIVGHVAILKLDDALRPHAARIASAVLAAQPRVATVALDEGVDGAHRVRGLTVIGGDDRLTTLHREHGLALEVDLGTTYFSPRLATERRRLADRIPAGARVLDLFAGVGAFVCLVARDRQPAQVTAIDLNPAATAALRGNLARNRLHHAPVEVLDGDARMVAPATLDWDHVVMNLPHGAFDFLDVAARCVARRGEIHLYAMVERADAEAFGARAAARLAECSGRPWAVAETRHVRSYAPTMDGLGYTLTADVKP